MVATPMGMDPPYPEKSLSYPASIQCWTIIDPICLLGKDTGPEVIKLFSCSIQLSSKFQLLIKTKIPTNKEVSCFKSLRCCIKHANKC